MLGPVVGTGLYQVQPDYPYMLSALLLVFVIGTLLTNRRLKSAVSQPS